MSAERLEAWILRPGVLSQTSSARNPQPGVLSKGFSARIARPGDLSKDLSPRIQSFLARILHLPRIQEFLARIQEYLARSFLPGVLNQESSTHLFGVIRWSHSADLNIPGFLEFQVPTLNFPVRRGPFTNL